ncbi:glutathione S-transferase Mu 4-like [Oscarella lobularis]|uniref:glutathione S-transferase Mu 4-like n=1 Tax=Oscarella lobularis TaxID=121494 RepID=UPI00331393D6
MALRMGYWNIRALGQSIRLLLEYCGEPYQDDRYNTRTGDWFDVKFKMGLPMPNLPYLIDGDIKIVQSNAVLRYIGRKHKMDGDTEVEKVWVDIFTNQVTDLHNGFFRLAFTKPDEFEAKKEDYLKNSLPSALQGFSNHLDSHKWLAGDKITFPDFHFAEMLDELTILSSTCLDEFPTLKAYKNQFDELPQIKAYRASDRYIDRPLHHHMATFN